MTRPSPERLFLMTTRMKGLPVAVLHDFSKGRATMKARLAGLLNVVDLGGPDLTRTETVTILNDLAFFAPSRLSDPRLSWTEIDDSRARVTFTLGTNVVSADLIFNAAGELGKGRHPPHPAVDDPHAGLPRCRRLASCQRG
jgi:hypothetical protein